MAFGNILIHSCTINRKTPDPSGNVDAYGQPIFTTSTTSHSCRFYRKRARGNTGLIVSSNLEYFRVPLSIMLLESVDILKDDTITTTSEGYAGTYTVSDIEFVYGRNTLHHKTADLVRVEV